MNKIITTSLLPLRAAIMLVTSSIMLSQPLPTYGKDLSIEDLIEERASESPPPAALPPSLQNMTIPCPDAANMQF
jgi:hypothetical protein